MIESVKYVVTEVFTTRLLGTAPADKEVYKAYIASKRADLEERKRKHEERSGIPSQPTPGTVEEEVETLNEEAGVTVFHNDVGLTCEDGTPGKGLHLYDYQVGGFWKEAAEALQIEHGVRQVRSKLDNFMLIEPRRVYITDMQGAVLQQADGKLERPLRAMTQQGPRVSLACSAVINPGRQITYTVDFLPYLKSGGGKEAKALEMEKFVEMIGWYAKRKGRGQWRSGGNGRFAAEIKPVEVKA